MTTFTAAGKLIVPGAATTTAGGTFKAFGANAPPETDGAGSFAAGGHFVAAGVGTVVGSSTHTGGGTFHAFCQITIDSGDPTFDAGGTFSAFGAGTPPVITGGAAFDGAGSFAVIVPHYQLSPAGISVKWTAQLVRPQKTEPAVKWLAPVVDHRVAIHAGTGGYASAYAGGYGGGFI